ALHTKDRNRLMGLLLKTACMDALKEFRISWRMRELLDQGQDKDLLLFLAKEVENARVISNWTTSAKPGFWPLAFGLVRMYPHDETVLSNLMAGILQQGETHWGPTSQFYEARKREVEQVLRDPSIPYEAHPWLRDVISRLERDIPREIVWEYD